MTIAITREVSPSIARCELTHVARAPIDVALACRQHEVYCDRLRELGCEVLTLPADSDLPDSVFVEDAAVVLDPLAIITRPGAESRRLEVHAIEQALSPYREITRIQAPATLDGGDVIVAGTRVYIGLSSRTSPEAISQVRHALATFGYSVREVPMHGCLHLKSACTYLGDSTMLMNPAFVDVDAFGQFECLEVHPDEPDGANALRIGDRLLYADAFPRTRGRLEERGFDVATVDLSELAKAEGAVTCSSLIVPSRDDRLGV